MKKRKRIKSRAIQAIMASTLMDYMDYLANKRTIIVNNLLAGLFRGLGMAVGFSVLGAIAIYILTLIFKGKIPGF